MGGVFNKRQKVPQHIRTFWKPCIYLLFRTFLFIMHYIQKIYFLEPKIRYRTRNQLEGLRFSIISFILFHCFFVMVRRKDALIMKASDMHPTLGWYYMDISLQVRVVKVSETRSNCFVEMNLDPEDRKGDLISRFGALGNRYYFFCITVRENFCRKINMSIISNDFLC